MHGGWKVSFPRVKPSHLNVTCCHGDGLIGLSRSSKEPVKRIVSSVISRLCCRLRVRHETCPHMAAGFFQISIRHAFPAFRLTFWIKRTCFFFSFLFFNKSLLHSFCLTVLVVSPSVAPAWLYCKCFCLHFSFWWFSTIAHVEIINFKPCQNHFPHMHGIHSSLLPGSLFPFPDVHILLSVSLWSESNSLLFFQRIQITMWLCYSRHKLMLRVGMPYTIK